MLSEFLININRLGAGRGQGVTLLTVSGGIDSVVMADLYYKAGLTCAVLPSASIRCIRSSIG